MYRNPIVVGLELSGDPFKNDFSSYAPVFLKARSLGIQTSIHFAESNIKEGEMAEMLDTDPQRIGHGIYLDNATAERLAREPKPIECCLSSSVFTNAISGYDKHPAFTQLKKRYSTISLLFHTHFTHIAYTSTLLFIYVSITICIKIKIKIYQL